MIKDSMITALLQCWEDEIPMLFHDSEEIFYVRPDPSYIIIRRNSEKGNKEIYQ